MTRELELEAVLLRFGQSSSDRHQNRWRRTPWVIGNKPLRCQNMFNYFFGYLGPSWVQIGSKSTEIDLKMAVWRLSRSFSTQIVQQVAQNGRGVDINPTHAQFGGRRTFLAVSGPYLCPYLGQTPPRARPTLSGPKSGPKMTKNVF